MRYQDSEEWKKLNPFAKFIIKWVARKVMTYI